MKWYENSFRRHLADMHLEDWNDEFFRDFEPQDYVDNLKKAHIQTAMIYLQSHVGYCNFITASGKAHRAMNVPHNKIQQLVELCHEAGISVVGYYSCIYNTWAHDTYKDWRMVNKDGLSMRQRIPHYRYGFCCPNNEDYREFVRKQIFEIADSFKLEGMFYDMLFWEDICYCPECRKRFRRETGLELPEKTLTPFTALITGQRGEQCFALPDKGWSDPVWIKFIEARARWMGDFAGFVADCTREAMPGVTVEHNYASAVAGDWRYDSGELVSNVCDYVGGDLYGDDYSHSFTAKYYLNVTKNQPFEYMTARCQVGLNRHTLTKSERQLRLETMLIAAHHGASFFIDAIDPKGTMDTRVYDRMGNVYAEQAKYEDTFRRGEHLEDAAVFYSAAGRYNPNGDDGLNSRTASDAAVRRLIRQHIPVGVINNTMNKDLSGYKVIIAPAVAGIWPEAKQGLIDYVNNGGSLYFSGNGAPELLEEFFNARIDHITEENCTYIAPAAGHEDLFSEFTGDYPLNAFCHQAVLANGGLKGEVIGRMVLPYTARTEDRYASIHSDPPGVWTENPSVLYTEYGKGRVMWSAVSFEAFEGWQYEEMLMSFIGYLGAKDWTLTTDAAEGVELVTFKTEEGYLISAVDMQSQIRDINDKPIRIEVKADGPKTVELLPERNRIPSEYKDGKVCFTLPALSQFAMCEVK